MRPLRLKLLLLLPLRRMLRRFFLFLVADRNVGNDVDDFSFLFPFFFFPCNVSRLINHIPSLFNIHIPYIYSFILSILQHPRNPRSNNPQNPHPPQHHLPPLITFGPRIPRLARPSPRPRRRWHRNPRQILHPQPPRRNHTAQPRLAHKSPHIKSHTVTR